MSNEDLTVLILDKLGWDYDLVVNPGHYKSTTDLYIGDLIKSLLELNTVELASKSLNRSYKAVNTAISRYFIPLFGKLNGGNETWKFKLLYLIEFKICCDCRKVLPFDKYNLDRSSPTGRAGYCKSCRVEHNAIEYQKDSTKESHLKSYEKNRPKIRERNIKYKGERALRVPKWSQTEQIVEFYSNCPEGYHVDHEIPLKGGLVSGLHVIQNLQYLTADENMKKGNKYEIS